MAGEGASSNTSRPLKKFRKIPIYIVEEHNDVLQFIYSAIGGFKLPLTGTHLLHFDSHPDMLIDREMTGHQAREGRSVLPLLSIENWIIPAVAAGHLSRVTWIRPPWATQLRDGVRTLNVGDDPQTNLLHVDCPEPYFLADGLYSPKLLRSQKLTLNVASLGDPDGQLDDAEEQSRELALRVCKGLWYILDIDLDFFSTLNPFKRIYANAKVYEQLKELYKFKYPEEMTPDDCERLVLARNRQIDELQDMFRHLDKTSSLDDYPGEKTVRYEAVLNIVSSIRSHYPSEKVDWLMLHEAGSTCDDGELPEHRSSREQIKSMLGRSFSPFVRSLPNPPTIITIARSSNDDYCPPDDVDYIQDYVLRILEATFDTDQPHLYYKK